MRLSFADFKLKIWRVNRRVGESLTELAATGACLVQCKQGADRGKHGSVSKGDDSALVIESRCQLLGRYRVVEIVLNVVFARPLQSNGET